jgi:hypothetical protein
VTVILALGLAALGALMLVGLIKKLKPQDERAVIPKTQKFWSFANIGYFIGILLASIIWIERLLIGFGVM